MMKWKLFNTEAQAKAYSHAEAVSYGLGKDGDVCQYWWTIRKTKTGKWAVECPEGTETPEFGDTNEQG